MDEMTVPFFLFYNCVAGSYYRIDEAIDPSLPMRNNSNLLQSIYFNQSPNRGKDIGGKLVLMNAYLRLGIESDYILLVHDKQSPYHSNSQQWKEELFKVAKRDYQEKVLDVFSNKKVGIVASGNAIRNELYNDENSKGYINSEVITKLKTAYQINPPDLCFVAGTMFWVRASIFEEFFTKFHPLDVRAQLEEGNVMDLAPTYTHAWERLLCWLVTTKGYQIIGI